MMGVRLCSGGAHLPVGANTADAAHVHVGVDIRVTCFVRAAGGGGGVSYAGGLGTAQHRDQKGRVRNGPAPRVKTQAAQCSPHAPELGRNGLKEAAG